jgi:1-deoxy-D-xylulose-5-phosphate synthase
MLYTGFKYNGVAAVRYPRGGGSGVVIQQKMQAIEIGTAEIRRNISAPNIKHKIAILSFGSMLTACLEAGEKLDSTVVNMRFVKPIDKNMLRKLANEHTLIVTVEENSVMGGAGSAVLEALQSIENQNKSTIRSLCLGLPDRFIEHGVHETMLAECGLDAEGIVSTIAKLIT